MTCGLIDFPAKRPCFECCVCHRLVSSSPWFPFLLELEVEVGMEELEEGGILHPTLKGLDNVFEIDAVYFKEPCTLPVCLPSDCDF